PGGWGRREGCHGGSDEVGGRRDEERRRLHEGGCAGIRGLRRCHEGIGVGGTCRRRQEITRRSGNEKAGLRAGFFFGFLNRGQTTFSQDAPRGIDPVQAKTVSDPYLLAGRPAK